MDNKGDKVFQYYFFVMASTFGSVENARAYNISHAENIKKQVRRIEDDHKYINKNDSDERWRLFRSCYALAGFDF